MNANQKFYKKGEKKTIEDMTDNDSKSAGYDEDSRDKKKGQSLSLKKTSENKTKKQSPRYNFLNTAVQFFKDARTELKKVKWPTKKELMASTTMVIILVLIVALYLGIVDIGLMNIINRIVD